MIFQQAMLHNIEQLIWQPENGDYLMCRVPEPVRTGLNAKAASNICFASNSELRFIMEGSEVTLVLRRAPVRGPILSHGILQVFQGDYQGSYEISPFAVGTEETEIRIRRQDFGFIQRFSRQGCRFSPEVTRVLLPYDWGSDSDAVQ